MCDLVRFCHEDYHTILLTSRKNYPTRTTKPSCIVCIPMGNKFFDCLLSSDHDRSALINHDHLISTPTRDHKLCLRSPFKLWGKEGTCIKEQSSFYPFRFLPADMTIIYIFPLLSWEGFLGSWNNISYSRPFCIQRMSSSCLIILSKPGF